MQSYNSFAYIYPPRPESTIGFDPSSPVYRAWSRLPDAIAQLKLNGSRNVIFISPTDEIQFWGRHKQLHRSYTIPDFLKNKIRELPYPKGKWNVFDSELIHLKTPSVKDTVCLFDTLVYNGNYLIGESYRNRYKYIQEFNLPFFPLGNKKGGIDEKIQGIFIAQNFPNTEWEKAFMSTGGNNRVQGGDIYEGLVLKRTGGTLAIGFQEKNNSSFMCRMRRPHKNFQF